MLEKAISGSKGYWSWLVFLLVVVGIGFGAYLYQYAEGLKITGMSRDVSWGFYIAQLTFMVGVAASAVMLVLPAYLHDNHGFHRITILGEFLAVPAVLCCLLFVVVDLGKPERLLNVVLHPTPNSVLFWDMVVLNVYMILNIIIGWNVLQAERLGRKVYWWVKVLIYISIPWAVSIHTVTAFLYAGLPGRGFWLTAIMAPRFLASAFAAGPALLILLAMLVRKLTNFDPGQKAINTLSKIVAYAIILHVFFFWLEVFTVFYSQIPGHMDHIIYLYFGLHGFSALVGWMWAAMIMGFVSIALLVPRKLRENNVILMIACILVFCATWIDKGIGMISGGFVPNPLHEITEYTPTGPELMITIGVYALGALVLTVLYKVAIGVKEELQA